MKICPVGTALFHAGRRTDTHEAISFFAIKQTRLITCRVCVFVWTVFASG